MNHKWENNICVRCGCEREKIGWGFGSMYLYTRSMIIKSNAKDLPCIDWEVENAKTID